MLNHTSKLNWLVVAVLLVVILSSSASWAAAVAEASDSDNGTTAHANKTGIIPEPTTLIVLLSGLVLFTCRRKYKGKNLAP